MTESRQSALEKFLAGVAALLALWILLTSIVIAREGWVPIPLADNWDRWSTYFRDHYTWHWFWEQHVDHRLVAPKLLFVVDHLVFAGRGSVLIVCSFFLQALTGILLLRLSVAAFPQNARERWILASAVFACVFSGQQWLNFIMPFQVQFPMVYCAALAAFFALWRAAQPDPQGAAWQPIWIALTILAAAISTYSMANGVLLWPVLLLAAVWLRAPRGPMIALGAAALAFGPTYLIHFQRAIVPLHLPFSQRVSHAVVFLLAQLGAPMSTLIVLWKHQSARLATTTIPGGLMLIALVVVSVTLWRRRVAYSSARAVLAFYCLFLGISSALIAYGRSEDPQFNAYLSKYLTPIYILWASMLLVSWPLVRRAVQNRPPLRASLYGGLCASVLLLIAIHQMALLPPIRQQTQGVRLGEVAIVDDVTDTDAWLWVFHPPEFTLDTVDRLRKDRLTLFTEEWTQWPGTVLAQRFVIDPAPGACQGRIEKSTPVPSPLRSGWRLTGWAWDTRTGRPPQYLVLEDNNGLIAGVALAGFPVPPALTGVPPNHPKSLWKGYCGGFPRPITAYLVEADNRSLCRIGTVDLR